MNKYITGILAAICVASLGGNFYLYTNNSNLAAQLSQQQEQYAQQQKELDSLTAQLEENNAVIADLEAQAQTSTQGAVNKTQPSTSTGSSTADALDGWELSRDANPVEEYSSDAEEALYQFIYGNGATGEVHAGDGSGNQAINGGDCQDFVDNYSDEAYNSTIPKEALDFFK